MSPTGSLEGSFNKVMAVGRFRGVFCDIPDFSQKRPEKRPTPITLSKVAPETRVQPAAARVNLVGWVPSRVQRASHDT